MIIRSIWVSGLKEARGYGQINRSAGLLWIQDRDLLHRFHTFRIELKPCIGWTHEGPFESRNENMEAGLGSPEYRIQLCRHPHDLDYVTFHAMLLMLQVGLLDNGLKLPNHLAGQSLCPLLRLV